MFQNTTEQIKSSNLYFPEFGGSTGGWLESAEMEEKYVGIYKLTLFTRLLLFRHLAGNIRISYPSII